MLEFWFNPHVQIFKKILLLIIIIAITGMLYVMQPLPLDAVLMFAGTGIVFLICRYCSLHFTADKPYGLLARFLKWIPIALLLALIFMHMKNGEILLTGAQGIGFMAIAICVFSPLSLLHKTTLPDA